MARHYSTKDFFRQMPNALLARYFHARGPFGDLGFSAMRETQPTELYAAWLELPDSQRNALDAESVGTGSAPEIGIHRSISLPVASARAARGRDARDRLPCPGGVGA